MRLVHYGITMIIKKTFSVLLFLVYSFYLYSSELFFNPKSFNIDSGVSYIIRKATIQDKENLRILYQKVASILGGLTRTHEEITEDYINKVLLNGINNGLALVAEYKGKLIGSMIKYKLEPKVFSHVLTEGSILIDPDFQGKGVGSNLILIFLKEIEENYTEILRVEVIARESNQAIKLYEKLGFKREGRLEQRIKGINGKLEADIPMAWVNPHFS